MRRTTTALAVSALSSTLVVLPTVSAPAASAQPVAPTVHALPLGGVDAAALPQSQAPDPDDLPVSTTGRPVAPAALKPLAVTRQLRTAPFSAVGVTWAADPAVDTVAVQVRTRTGGRWTDWSEIEVQANAGGDAGSAESKARRDGSDPLYVGPSDGVQVRVDGGRAKPRDLKLELIDPGTSPADAYAAAATAGRRTLGGAVARAAVAMPAYVTRAGWGADERLRSCTPSVASTIKGGILHTTASGNDYSAAQSPAIMRSMYAYHTQSLGWCDLGYNFVVDKFGTLFESRYGGVDRPVIGAHTGGFNTYTFGVSMMGNQDLVAPTAAMLATVEQVFAWKLGRYGLDANATTQYTSAGGSSTRYAAGTVVTKSVISGHRDYSSKSCPGNYAYPLLPQIRNAAAARIASTTPPPPPAATKAATTLTAQTSPTTITYGAATTISGKLTTAAGAPVAGKPVQIYVRKQGTSTYALLSTRTTAADGTFSGTHKPLTNVEYAARFREDATYTASGHNARTNVAPAATTLTAQTSPTTITYGAATTISGKLTTAAGAPVAGKPVQIYVRKQGTSTYALLSTRTTAADGTFSGTHKPLTNVEYAARFREDATYTASGHNARTNVAPAVSAAFSATSVRLGGAVALRGRVTPAHAGQEVVRQQLVSGKWLTLATATLTSSGTYSFSVKPTSRGTKTYRVVKPADSDHVTAVSASRALVAG